MKALALIVTATLVLGAAAQAAEGSSGTTNNTGANDAGSGATPGAAGRVTGAPTC